MMEVRHVYALTISEAKRYDDYFSSKTDQPVVVHRHTVMQECEGDCPLFNAPDEDEFTQDFGPRRGTITIQLEVSDSFVAEDICNTLDNLLPYMADNVFVSSEWE